MPAVFTTSAIVLIALLVFHEMTRDSERVDVRLRVMARWLILPLLVVFLALAGVRIVELAGAAPSHARNVDRQTQQVQISTSTPGTPPTPGTPFPGPRSGQPAKGDTLQRR